MKEGGEILFFIFQDYTEIGDGWLKLYLFVANHLYLVDKEDFFIIFQGIMKKTNVVCNNQNSLERAIFINTHGICQYRAEES